MFWGEYNEASEDAVSQNYSRASPGDVTHIYSVEWICFLSAKLERMHLPWPFDSICSLPISFLHRAHTHSVLPSMACTAPESCSTCKCTFGVHSKSISSIWAYWVFIKNSITSCHPRLLSEIIVQSKSKLCHQLKSWVGYYWCILCYKIKCKNVLQ